MRKFMVGLMVGSLLAVAAPAMAQQGGVGDPLSLAASGVLIPFFGSAGDASLLEVASPVAANPDLHMFFFNANCARVGDSVGLPLTTNDIAFLQIGSVVPGLQAGLVTIARSDASGFNLVPLPAGSPIHARMYMFSGATGRSRIAEPIVLDSAEFPGDPHTWSPLRTAATFFAPQQSAPISTTLWLICPKNTIQGLATAAFSDPGFPVISPAFPAARSLRARVYDTSETFLRDIRTGCDCVRQAAVSDISNIYSDPLVANGSYTEIESDPSATPADNAGFTGYRSVSTSAINDFFGRLSNGNRSVLQGIVGPGAR